jgi:predicted HicB family RNase H-like nuclease
MNYKRRNMKRDDVSQKLIRPTFRIEQKLNNLLEIKAAAAGVSKNLMMHKILKAVLVDFKISI